VAALISLAGLQGCVHQKQPVLGGPAPPTVDQTDPGGVSFVAVVDSDSVARGGSRFLDRITGRDNERSLFQRPYGAAWDGDSLLVTDPSGGRVVRIDERGRIASSRRGEFDSPIGVAACSIGIVVTDSRRGTVTLLDEKLRPSERLAEKLVRPTGVACFGASILVVETGRHRIVSLQPAGTESGDSKDEPTPMTTWGRRGEKTGEFNFPTVIAVAGDAVWVGDAMNFRVQLLRGSDGAFRRAFGHLGDAPGEMPRIKGLVVDAVGRLWISDAHLDSVALYDGDGTFLAAIGGAGDGPGQFSFPTGIAAHPDGRVAVVDSFNRRVQIFHVAAVARDGS